jgi:heme oxygenase
MSDTLTRLQRALRERTDAIDAIVHAPLMKSPTRAGYRRWVCDLYHFISAFETRFAFAPGIEIVFIASRIKSGRLASDLLALGLTGAEYQRLSRRQIIPVFSTASESLGWLFVVERITLQLAALREQLQPSLAKELAIAGSFFEVYEGAVAERWNELGEAVERAFRVDADLRILTASASTALNCLQGVTAQAIATTVHVDLAQSA